ncbi:MAG: hypothetical protein ACTSU2_11605 [Promethearchaeota archaeon]
MSGNKVHSGDLDYTPPLNEGDGDITAKKIIEFYKRKKRSEGLEANAFFDEAENINLVERIINILKERKEIGLQELYSELYNKDVNEIKEEWKTKYSKNKNVRKIRRIMYLLEDLLIIKSITKRTVQTIEFYWVYTPENFLQYL